MSSGNDQIQLLQPKILPTLYLCYPVSWLLRYYYMHVRSQQLSRVTLYDPIDCSQLDSSVHGILQARILEWVAIPFSSRSSPPGIKLASPALSGRFFTTESPGKSHKMLCIPFTFVYFFIPFISSFSAHSSITGILPTQLLR